MGSTPSGRIMPIYEVRIVNTIGLRADDERGAELKARDLMIDAPIIDEGTEITVVKTGD